MEDDTKKKKEEESAGLPLPIRTERVHLRQGQCILLHGFLTPLECMELIQRTEKAGYKENDRLERTSDCSRVSFYDSALADKLWTRVEPFVVNTYPGNWKKKGLNDYWRFCRYQEGQYFGAHVDGVFVRGKRERSKLTLMIYLSEDFVGGTTRFFTMVPKSVPSKRAKNDRSKGNRREKHQDAEPQEQINYLEDNQAMLRVTELKIVDTRFGARALAYELVPRIGLAVLFDQEGLLHDGLAVFKGVKYIMRTDVQFERMSDSKTEEKEKEKETEKKERKKGKEKGSSLYKKKK